MRRRVAYGAMILAVMAAVASLLAWAGAFEPKDTFEVFKPLEVAPTIGKESLEEQRARIAELEAELNQFAKEEERERKQHQLIRQGYFLVFLALVAVVVVLRLYLGELGKHRTSSDDRSPPD